MTVGANTVDGQKEGESLGLGLSAGEEHYRAYVGPPGDYDLVGAMSFNLLTTLGLRQHHRLLDLGCGSLRVGRLLIPYLNVGCYTGLEPNAWLVREGIARETGEDQIRIKQAEFIYSDRPSALQKSSVFDFVLAQSIFSHCGLELIASWLESSFRCLKTCGALVATAVIGDEDFIGSGWIYPEVVAYRWSTLHKLASRTGFSLEELDWKHPRQTWLLFGMPGFDTSWLRGRPLSWNLMLESRRNGRRVPP